jgi:hypothetical protein
MFSLSLRILKNMIEILKSKTMNGSGKFAIFNTSTSTYIVPSWTKVPANTKVEDVIVIDDGPVKEQPIKQTFSKHTVKGSTGKMYEVIIDTSYGNSCTCPGFGFRRECKHIKQILTK